MRPQNVQERSVPMQARISNGQLRKRLVVLPFLDTANYRSEKVRDAARKAFLERMVSSQQFVFIPPDDLGKSADSFKKQEEYDLQAVAEYAKTLDLSGIIEGKILEVKARRIGDQVGLFRKLKANVSAVVQIRVYSPKNNKLLMTETYTANVESETRQFGEYSTSDRGLEDDPELVFDVVSKAFRGAVIPIAKSIDKLNWTGRVAMIRGDRIYINAGRLTGLQMGDILRVTDNGEEVYDPDTGKFLGRAPGRTKGTIELVNYFGNDGAVAIIHSGSGFAENDILELY